MKDFNTILGVLFYHALRFQSPFNLPSYFSVTVGGVEQTCSSRSRLFSRSNSVSKIVPPAVKFHTGDEPALHRS